MTISELVQKEIYSDETLLDGSIQEYRKDIERVVAKYTILCLEKHLSNIPKETWLARTKMIQDINELQTLINNQNEI